MGRRLAGLAPGAASAVPLLGVPPLGVSPLGVPLLGVSLLALALSRRTGIPVLVDGLVRTRATPSQGRLNRAQRQRNVQGAFSVRPARKPRIAGKSVLLVDDVLTTGATLGACARALRKAGAARVEVVTIARVTRTG